MTDLLVVNSKVREAVKSLDMNVAGDFSEGLSKEVFKLIKVASNRAKENNRKTVRAIDL